MIEKLRELKRLALDLETDEYGEISDAIGELEDAYEKITENAILNIDRFKRELEEQGLMNEKLRDFIENYMRFDNKK